MRFPWPAFAALVCALVVGTLGAGCTTEVAGRPSAPTGVLLPPRPREVRLDGVDPCSLLTPEQRAELKLDGAPLYDKSYVELFGGEVPTCTITGYVGPRLALAISIVTTTGIERWQRGDLDARVSPTTIAGFPAIVAVPSRFTNYCSVDVDVAAGQLLDVQMSDGGGSAPVPQSDLCGRAEQAGSELLTSLLAR